MGRKIIIYSLAFIVIFLIPIILRAVFINTDPIIPTIIYLILVITINSLINYYFVNIKNWIRIIISIAVVFISLDIVYFSTRIGFLDNLYNESNNIVTFAFIGFLMILFQELSLKFLRNKRK